MNTLIDYLSRYSFGHFCCRVKQGKRLSEFLQKYTDSGTENTHLTGYHILVVKYVKISAGLPLFFIGAIAPTKSRGTNSFFFFLRRFCTPARWLTYEISWTNKI